MRFIEARRVHGQDQSLGYDANRFRHQLRINARRTSSFE
jgi:hypothetical protein